MSATLVLVTHEHPDHNGVEVIGGDPAILRWTAGRLQSPIGEVVAVASEHDQSAGTQRGPNTIFVSARTTSWMDDSMPAGAESELRIGWRRVRADVAWCWSRKNGASSGSARGLGEADVRGRTSACGASGGAFCGDPHAGVSGRAPRRVADRGASSGVSDSTRRAFLRARRFPSRTQR